MAGCPTCLIEVTPAARQCPACQTWLLAPTLAPHTAVGNSLAPSLYSGPRLEPSVNLSALLEAATEGSEVALGPGTFVLHEGTTVRHGIALTGAGVDATRIECSGQDFVLRVLTHSRFFARGITFAHQGRKPADVLWILDGSAEFMDCRFEGAVSGPTLLSKGGADAARPFRPGGRGLWFGGQVHGWLRRCELLGNALDGLEATGRSVITLENCSVMRNRGAGVVVRDHATLSARRGRATSNYRSGLELYNDAAGDVQDVSFVGNGASGIAVFGRARPTLVNNTLSQNQRSGLAYWASSGGEARENRISHNTGPGVEVLDTAGPRLQANEVVDNRGSGLLFTERARGSATGNYCARNGGHGLDLRGAADPRLEGNEVVDNLQAGRRG